MLKMLKECRVQLIKASDNNYHEGMGLWTEAARAFQVRAEPYQRSPLGWGRVNRSMWGPPRPPKPSHTRGTTLLLLVCNAIPQTSATSSQIHVCWQPLPQKRKEKTTLSGVSLLRSQVL